MFSVLLVLVLIGCVASAPHNSKYTSVCQQPMFVGQCEALILRYFYNPTMRQCENFFYGGCGGNGNNFHTLQDCIDKCQVH